MRRVRLLLIVVTAIVLLLIAVPAYAAPAATAGGPGCVQWYTVQCGDTLNKIASSLRNFDLGPRADKRDQQSQRDLRGPDHLRQGGGASAATSAATSSFGWLLVHRPCG